MNCTNPYCPIFKSGNYPCKACENCRHNQKNDILDMFDKITKGEKK